MTNEYQTDAGQLEAIIEKVTGYKPSSYDTFLAHETENIVGRPTMAPHKPPNVLYSAIDAMCEQLDHRLFDPVRVIKTEEYGELTFRDTFAVCNSIMIPKTKFFLCDLNALTGSVIKMIHKAGELEKPQIYFYDKELLKISSQDVLKYVQSLKDNSPGFKAAIGYEDVGEFMRLLRQVIKYNFK